jgi:two-component system response regulator LytT
MKIAIIEDEALAAERLEKLIKELTPEAQIMIKLQSVAGSVEWLKDNTPDLIFLDIQLSDGVSFSIFDQIKNNIPVIFTTAYEEYAIRAFKLNSIDYLLKPIRANELRQSLEKFQTLKKPASPNFEQLLKMLQNKEESYKKRFMVKYGQVLQKVEVEDIAYFYAMEKSVFLTTFKNEMLAIDYTLDKLLPIVDPKKFFRINRKMIINIKAIKRMYAYSRSRIKLDLTPPEPKKIEALVSIERTTDFKNWIDE